jgi:serine/threonine protein kinase
VVLAFAAPQKSEKRMAEERIYGRGELIGHYQVLTHLATGGFCSVYEAQDLNDGEAAESSAIKVCRYEPRTLTAPERAAFNRRMHREFIALSSIEHDNVVAVLEERVHAGLSYFAMELRGASPLEWC